MSAFTLHTIDSAPAAAAPILEGAKKGLGFIPNLYAHLAEAPTALQAYKQLGALLEQSSFSSIEQQVILLAVSVENQCEYCVAAHSFLARNLARVPAATIDALRNGGKLLDHKLNTLAEFTRVIVRERGWVSDSAELQRFYDSGYKPQQALEVVLGVTMKTLSNYANHLTATPLDSAFAAEAWHKPERQACC